MLNTNILIKEAAFDIITVITIWGLLNNLYLNIHINKKISYIYPLYWIWFFSIYYSKIFLNKYSSFRFYFTLFLSLK